MNKIGISGVDKTPRDAEENMLMRCVAAAQGSTVAQDQCEANVFRLAGMVISSDLPAESARLKQAGEDYFTLHPDNMLPAEEVVRRSWIFSLPRLRDMLALKLHQNAGNR